MNSALAVLFPRPELSQQWQSPAETIVTLRNTGKVLDVAALGLKEFTRPLGRIETTIPAEHMRIMKFCSVPLFRPGATTFWSPSGRIPSEFFNRYSIVPRDIPKDSASKRTVSNAAFSKRARIWASRESLTQAWVHLAHLRCRIGSPYTRAEPLVMRIYLRRTVVHVSHKFGPVLLKINIALARDRPWWIGECPENRISRALFIQWHCRLDLALQTTRCP
jgi:hypothetical protein